MTSLLSDLSKQKQFYINKQQEESRQYKQQEMKEMENDVKTYVPLLVKEILDKLTEIRDRKINQSSCWIQMPYPPLSTDRKGKGGYTRYSAEQFNEKIMCGLRNNKQLDGFSFSQANYGMHNGIKVTW